jgi:hypothetical protein
MVDVRKGQGDVKLTGEEFKRRLRERFYDLDFQNVELPTSWMLRRRRVTADRVA